MNAYSKGILSREKLILESRDKFNELGLNLTLNNLAKCLKITLGKLTYHFPTKDHLFVAIAEDYEIKLNELRSNFNYESFSLKMLYDIANVIMDLQYEYRCAMRYIASASNNQSELFIHLNENYKNSKNRIQSTLETLVSVGELNVTILEEQNNKVLFFCFTNLFTFWPINLEIYDTDSSYEQMKVIYLKGIFSTFFPYLTPKGYEVLKSTSIWG